jgi:hypothetical protein
MLTGGFLRQKWPQRHDHLVEECVSARRALHVTDVLPDLMEHWHDRVISRWSPPTHPRLTLVPRMAGPFRRWWFLCPRCRRRCETLFVPPTARAGDWRCRVCQGLIYASQRYGSRHPLRGVLTRRKKITCQKDARRQERRWARQAAEQRHRLASYAPDHDVTERVIAGLRAFGEMLEREKEQAMNDREVDKVKKLIEAEAERSLEVLRELAATAKSKRVREQARKDFERRTGKRITPEQ